VGAATRLIADVVTEPAQRLEALLGELVGDQDSHCPIGTTSRTAASESRSRTGRRPCVRGLLAIRPGLGKPSSVRGATGMLLVVAVMSGCGGRGPRDTPPEQSDEPAQVGAAELGGEDSDEGQAEAEAEPTQK